MPQNFEELIAIYKKVIEPKLQNWAVFENGTCVIIYNSPRDLKEEATEVLEKYGQIIPGTSSADFTVLKVDSGWIVAGDQAGILNYVSENEGSGKEDPEIGLIGRNKKEQDRKESKIIYINSST
ncbi:MAG: hypothetical protein Q7S45_01005 [Candidatus Curtissbacteria bacterium]|nr:hypothetical protein [Candidatus Curtissbacteria bacterium]